MGRILFIRVSAQTYDEKEVLRAWPKLYASIWPDPEVNISETPAGIIRKLVPAPGKGVLELLDAFTDHVSFGDLPQGWRAALQTKADALAALGRELDDALGEQDVHRARPLCTAIEDGLDEAEAIMRRLSA